MTKQLMRKAFAALLGVFTGFGSFALAEDKQPDITAIPKGTIIVLKMNKEVQPSLKERIVPFLYVSTRSKSSNTSSSRENFSAFVCAFRMKAGEDMVSLNGSLRMKIKDVKRYGGAPPNPRYDDLCVDIESTERGEKRRCTMPPARYEVSVEKVVIDDKKLSGINSFVCATHWGHNSNFDEQGAKLVHDYYTASRFYGGDDSVFYDPFREIQKHGVLLLDSFVETINELGKHKGEENGRYMAPPK